MIFNRLGEKSLRFKLQGVKGLGMAGLVKARVGDLSVFKVLKIIITTCFNMFKENLIIQINQHRFATALYLMYILCWITVYCLFFSGVKIGQLTIYGFFLSIPYSLITLSLTLLIKKSSTFYLWLTYLIYLPIIVTLILIMPLF